jgi:hypothetical protein
MKTLKAAKPDKPATTEERIAALEAKVESLHGLLHEHGIRHKPADEPADSEE